MSRFLLRQRSAPTTVDAAILIGLLGLLGYWSLQVLGPFLTVALWSAILAVALYPLFDWLARQLGSRRLAAVLITLLCLLVVIGPVTWLGFGLIGGVEMLIEKLGTELPSIPPPPESVKGWPVIGEHVHRLWTTAATDMKAILTEVAPKLKPVGGKLVDIAGGVVFGLLQFIAAIIIAGFLFSPGPRLVDSLTAFARRILSDRGEEMVQLAGNTIRNVSRGVVGVALVQSFFAGLGFLVAGVPAAGFLSLSGPAARDHSDRAGDPADPHHHLELAGDGDNDGRPGVHGLHATGRVDGQRAEANRHGARGGNAHAGHSYWGRRRDNSLRDQRLVSGPDHLVGRLGIARGLDPARPRGCDKRPAEQTSMIPFTADQTTSSAARRG